jgi:two-component system uhpT operon response regulator UhpA
LRFLIKEDRTLVTIKITLVDDHKIVREGFKQLIELEPDMNVIAEFDGFDDAVSSDILHSSDVCVIDISLGSTNGLELARALKENSPNIAIIILSMYEQAIYVSEALSIGVAAYLSKRTVSEDLIEAIKSVTKGRTFYSQSILFDVNCSQKQILATLDTLTTREFEVFKLMAQGKEVKRIASEIGVATKTAHVHRRNAMMKLNISSSFEATQLALKYGLLDATNLYE